MMRQSGIRGAAMGLICLVLFVAGAARAEHNHAGQGEGSACKEEKHECAEHHQAHEGVAASEQGANPLIAEMQTLDGVFRDVVSAVSLGDGGRVEHALHAMHGTMEKTHEGVHRGTVKLRKNESKLKTFVQMDKEFHAGLERLAAAATRNDQKAMLTLTKDLLDRCVKCHAMFR